ncbi:uncharacterized protein LOC113509100 [Galleria mellonella]|uniref:Uncharacterized protein LOC113509100 n=1 Tax=Galleria mellonella TaxID=7137 RepID=A0A6J1W720_GALME|nr:uncharacterized protein LOC113509100 [Galleria mellonella]
MLLSYLFFILLFSNLVYGKNSTQYDTSKNVPSAKQSDQDDSNSPKIVSEGGPISPIPSTLTQFKENHTNLISVDKELGKNKERPVVARKGVEYPPLEDKDILSFNSTEELKDVVQNKFNITVSASSKGNMKKDHEATEKLNNVPVIQNVSTIPLKPTVLSYEALEEIEQHTNSESVSIKSSSESVIIDQIPNPNINKKFQSMNASRPDLIMPIVITVLTVPLFVVLGYMALRRGHEAWKNRHYKRMDFLLDGMYND